jgi:hypothetical protein
LKGGKLTKTAEKSDDEHKVSRHKIKGGLYKLSCVCGWPGPSYPIQEVFVQANIDRHVLIADIEKGLIQ